MGKKDTVTKKYIKDNHIFADIFNYLIYHGEAVIQPEQLKTADSTEIGIPYMEKGTSFPVQKYRDELKSITIMKDSSHIYLLLGIENQSDTHYAMPVKNMVYDALQYASQIEKASKKHRLEKQKTHSNIDNITSKPSAAEYLTGFYKEDRLTPVITLVVYWGTEAWEAPLNLHDMFSVKEPEILSFIPDYQINLIAPAFMDDQELNKFQTSLREVFLFVKYSKNKQKLYETITTDSRYKNLEKQAAMVINVLTGAKLQFDEKNSEVIDVCKAIEDMRTEERELGRTEGHTEATLSAVKNLIIKQGLTVKQSMDILDIPHSKYDYYAEKLHEYV